MAKSGSGSNKLLIFLTGIMLLLVFAAITDFFFAAQNTAGDNQFLGYAAEQAVMSQGLAKNTEQAVTGDKGAFQRLSSARDRFDRTLTLMKEGNSDPQNLMSKPPKAVLSEVGLLDDHWGDAKKDVNTIIDARDNILLAQQQLAAVNDSMPQLLARIDQMADMLTRRNASRQLIYHVSREAVFGQRIQREMTSLVTGLGNPVDAANSIGGDTAYFGRVLQAMYDGDPQLGIQPVTDQDLKDVLAEADALFGRVKGAVDTVQPNATQLVEVHKARQAIGTLSDTLLGNVHTVQSTYQRSVHDRLFQTTYGYILGGAALLVLGIIFFVYNLTSDTRRAAALQAEQTERNQQAILRLLDELGSLADGDLTVQVSVTEDITGAIADSINYAIEALRDLVATINETAVQVDSTAQQTRATASHLADASDNQSREITSASHQITEMAKSIEQVSANAERSTRVAQQAVEIAHKGGEAVRRTIDGMNSIRENIQETSKRIKRLGESSQEIGDIVELINDIAEQTNILALNAAIQASMAGEAGRGFAVVADEVQRLAERSGNATRQIEALVKTIQTDTNEAVISMEHSTAGVVSGAQLAENAGSALDEIEKVSNHIATLIQSISSAARQQATAASDVSRTMNVIQEITSQTAEGTSATARNIGKLAALATELRKSVAGFKLPGMEGEETMVIPPEAVEEQIS
ncbi:MAG: methyl-accepting chemotaxis protein [Gammaproteobacteria bacterium]|jgi:twitching motility protein PilJ